MLTSGEAYFSRKLVSPLNLIIVIKFYSAVQILIVKLQDNSIFLLSFAKRLR